MSTDFRTFRPPFPNPELYLLWGICLLHSFCPSPVSPSRTIALIYFTVKGSYHSTVIITYPLLYSGSICSQWPRPTSPLLSSGVQEKLWDNCAGDKHLGGRSHISVWIDLSAQAEPHESPGYGLANLLLPGIHPQIKHIIMTQTQFDFISSFNVEMQAW